MAPKISIIVPVYNVEKYLSTCLDSLINQTLKDIEIICVNDGSTDGSLEILNEYAKKDTRIKIITQKNQGLSMARNNGLKEAKGEYISFIDSDDWIDTKMYEKMYQQATEDNTEIVVCNLKLVRGSDEELNDYWPIKKNGLINREEAQSYLFKYPSYAVNKIYKKNFLIKNNLQFIKGILYEDVPFWVLAILNVSRISYCIDYLYHYRLSREDAITKKKSEKQFDVIKVVDITKKLLAEYNVSQQITENFINWQKQIFVWMYHLLPENKQSEALHFFDGLDVVIKNDIYKKLFTTKCKLYFCGIKICSFRTKRYVFFQKLFSSIPFFQLKKR